MELVFIVAVAWTVGVATWMVRMLTRNQRRIAEVVRRVAAGDLSARVGALEASGDEARLVRDLDDMIERLSNLFSAQRVFIAHAAHELRSPLTALYGELALALRRSRDAEEYRARHPGGVSSRPASSRAWRRICWRSRAWARRRRLRSNRSTCAARSTKRRRS